MGRKESSSAQSRQQQASEKHQRETLDTEEASLQRTEVPHHSDQQESL